MSAVSGMPASREDSPQDLGRCRGGGLHVVDDAVTLVGIVVVNVDDEPAPEQRLARGRVAAKRAGLAVVDDKHDVVVGRSERGAQGDEGGGSGQLVQRATRCVPARGTASTASTPRLGEGPAEREGGPEAVRIRIPVREHEGAPRTMDGVEYAAPRGRGALIWRGWEATFQPGTAPGDYFTGCGCA